MGTQDDDDDSIPSSLVHITIYINGNNSVRVLVLVCCCYYNFALLVSKHLVKRSNRAINAAYPSYLLFILRIITLNSSNLL